MGMCLVQSMVSQRVLKPTPISASQLPTLYYLELLPMVQECLGPRNDKFRCHQWCYFIVASTTFMHVGNMLHYISGWFKAGLGWLVNAYYSHSIHRGGGYVGVILFNSNVLQLLLIICTQQKLVLHSQIYNETYP